MNRVTRPDGSELYINAEFIQSVESTPDTHLALLSGQSRVVMESDAGIVERILGYQRSVHGGGSAASGEHLGADIGHQLFSRSRSGTGWSRWWTKRTGAACSTASRSSAGRWERNSGSSCR